VGDAGTSGSGAGTSGSAAGTTGRAGTTGSAGTTGRGGGAGTTGRGGTTGGAGRGGTTGSAGSGGTTGRGGGAGTGQAGTTGTAGTVGTSSATFPLKAVAGQHYLVDQNNRPFFLVGEAAWALIAGLSTADATAYLDDRKSRGFNSIIVSLIEHKFAVSAPKDAAGDLPFTGTLSGGARDFSTPNEAYFAHADQVISAAAARGILVQLVPAYLGYTGTQEGWYDEMVTNGTSRLTTYGTYVGNRYKTFPNIIWVAAGDRNPADPSLTNAVESAIRSADTVHLHTAHCQEQTSPVDQWAARGWLDVSNVYTYPFDGEMPIWQLSRSEYTRSGWKPFFMIESAYENAHSSTAQQRRQEAYEGPLNGGFGSNSGNEWLWPFGAVDAFGGQHTDWKAQMPTQTANDMGRMGALFSARHWETLVPDTAGTFVTAGAGTGTARASGAVSADGKLGMVYVPSNGTTVTINMTKVASTVTARWYDPSNGAFMAIAGPLSSSSQAFTPPGKNAGGDGDWVLVLEAP
jgi:hypothetical protein